MAPATRPAAAPWYVWLAVLSVTSAMIGTHWDISWHRSIGRDTFWTPAHIAIYLCGVLSGISCGYLILSTTFGKSPSSISLRASSVNIWGFHGPLGAFIAAWGGFAMLTSAPFDDWWHNAYGLDVKILSPPHMVLALGMVSVEIGALILILGSMNRASGIRRMALERLFLYVAGMIVVALLLVSLEYQGRVLQHTATFYRVICMLVPMVLAMAARATGYRWAATTVTAVYTILLLGMVWILPLFPAQPKLGPVYYQVTHFVPSGFPLLIVGPALVLDWLWSRTENWGPWKQSLISGSVFLAVLFAVQWPFADFLQSAGARNWVFGSAYFDYLTGPTSYQRRYLFWRLEPTLAAFWTQMALALLFAVITTRLGLAAGNWMRRVQR
ncbi:MAG TPA: hypothetical protein VGL72_00765 [Bryobacteraceae bacterium]